MHLWNPQVHYVIQGKRCHCCLGSAQALPNHQVLTSVRHAYIMEGLNEMKAFKKVQTNSLMRDLDDIGHLLMGFWVQI